ncbi:hypothetical protein ACQPYE_08170 [Actinosynnema sp. CA-299493]
MTTGYIEASSLAKKHNISISTIRRRVFEGKLFPGAKKRQVGLKEIWIIPRSEAEAASLKDISPKLHHKRRHSATDLTTEQANPLAVKSLEDRIARLERLYVKLATDGLESTVTLR